MQQYVYIIGWAVALAAFLIIEGATAQLVTIWFALGSLASLIAAWLKAPVWLQFVLFVVVSGITLAATRPFVKKMTSKTKQPTNADRIIGGTGIVTEAIDNLKASGAINASGSVWTARSADGETIGEGEEVIIEKIEGVKAIVRRK